MNDNDFYKDQTASSDQTMTIPADCFVTGVNLEDAKPFIRVENESDSGSAPDRKIELPPALAFFLRVHWCCTNDVRRRIEKDAKEALQDDLKQLLGIRKSGLE